MEVNCVCVIQLVANHIQSTPVAVPVVVSGRIPVPACVSPGPAGTARPAGSIIKRQKKGRYQTRGTDNATNLALGDWCEAPATTKDEASPLDLNETRGLCIGQGNNVGELDEQKEDEVGDVSALTENCCVVPGWSISS